MRLGFQVSIAGKIYEAVDRAKELGAQTMQIFSRNPRGWQVLELDRGDTREFKKRRKRENIFPLFIHIPYLINLASPDKRLYVRSINAYIDDIMRTDLLEAEFFITHLGSHVRDGEERGIERFVRALNLIIKKSNPKTTILLETTAGSGSSLGYRFEQIARIINRIEHKEKIGVCLDTQHIYAAGYDIVNDLNGTIRTFDGIIGINKLMAIHLNDSKSVLGSRVDRHEHIGKGKIGLSAFRKILNHPALKHLPFVMETPKKTARDDFKNMKVVMKLCKMRSLAKGLGVILPAHQSRRAGRCGVLLHETP